MTGPRQRRASGAVTRLYPPRPVDVVPGARGAPAQVNGLDVVAIREEWIVEDGWWTASPVNRRYFELVLVDGRDLTVFRAASGEWLSQRA